MTPSTTRSDVQPHDAMEHDAAPRYMSRDASSLLLLHLRMSAWPNAAYAARGITPQQAAIAALSLVDIDYDGLQCEHRTLSFGFTKSDVLDLLTADPARDAVFRRWLGVQLQHILAQRTGVRGSARQRLRRDAARATRAWWQAVRTAPAHTTIPARPMG